MVSCNNKESCHELQLWKIDSNFAIFDSIRLTLNQKVSYSPGKSGRGIYYEHSRIGQGKKFHENIRSCLEVLAVEDDKIQYVECHSNDAYYRLNKQVRVDTEFLPLIYHTWRVVHS